MLADACLARGVPRVVHVSSISVYQPLPDGLVDETIAAQPCGWAYPDTKLRIELRLLQRQAEEGLPVVILQPTIVYGPFGGMWTTGMVERLRSRVVVLPRSGEGLCNAVYVDDVVDALILAAGAESVVGERILVSGPAPVTWAGFYGAFERLLGVRSVMPLEGETPGLWPVGMAKRTRSGSPMRHHSMRGAVGSMVRRRTVRRVLRPMQRVVGERWVRKARRALPGPRPLLLPEGELLALYRARAQVDIGKAKLLLGYEPRFDLERGMRLTEAFLSSANLLPAGPAGPREGAHHSGSPSEVLKATTVRRATG